MRQRGKGLQRGRAGVQGTPLAWRKTVTFDRNAAKLAGFKLLPTR
jgi:hypothetical protein